MSTAAPSDEGRVGYSHQQTARQSVPCQHGHSLYHGYHQSGQSSGVSARGQYASQDILLYAHPQPVGDGPPDVGNRELNVGRGG